MGGAELAYHTPPWGRRSFCVVCLAAAGKTGSKNLSRGWWAVVGGWWASSGSGSVRLCGRAILRPRLAAPQSRIDPPLKFETALARFFMRFRGPQAPRTDHGKRWSAPLKISVAAGFLGAVDHQHLHGALARFELQPKLLPDGAEDGQPSAFGGGTSPPLFGWPSSGTHSSLKSYLPVKPVASSTGRPNSL